MKADGLSASQASRVDGGTVYLLRPPLPFSLSANHPHAAGAASSDGRRAGRPARTGGWHGTGWGGRHAGRPAWAGGAHDETGGAHAGRLEREAGTALAGTRPDAQE
jgi:hypothetical protein